MQLRRARWPRSAMGSIFFVLCCLICQSAVGIGGIRMDDEVFFTDGDRLSGEISVVNQDWIMLNNTALGMLKIPWTNVTQIKSQGRSWRLQMISEGSRLPYAEFKNAVFSKSDGVLMATFDSQQVEVPQKFEIQLGNQEHKTAGPVEAAPAKPSTNANTSIDISLNSPVTVVDGTSSQETFGGTLRFLVNLPDLCKPASWFTTIQLMANHNRAWKVKSAAVVTDTFDGNLMVDHGIDSHGKVDAYLTADYWGNSSLGVGLQQSYGGGISTVLYSTSCTAAKNYQLVLSAKGGLRYIRQRLYAPAASPLDLAGVRAETALTYQPFKKGTRIPFFTLETSLWAMPMINNERAIQAGGSAGLSFPLGKSLTLGFTEEDDYVNNAPKLKRKNYLKSGATITYSFPPPPSS